MSNNSITIKNLCNDEEIVVTKRVRNIHTDRFTMIGRNESMDSLRILAHMKPQEARVIISVMDNLEYKTNIADLSMARKDETPTDKVQFSVGYGRLKKLGVLIRISWNVFMVNPKFVLPPVSELEKVNEMWEMYTNN